MFSITLKKLTITGVSVILLAPLEVVHAEAPVVSNMMPMSNTGAVVQEAIPPAPAGPYKSTGLQDVVEEAKPVVSAPSRKNAVAQTMPVKSMPPVSMSPVKVKSQKVPMAAFSPDRPWPVDLRPPVPGPSGPWVTKQGAVRAPVTRPNYQVPATVHPSNSNASSYYMNRQQSQQMPAVVSPRQRTGVYMPNYGLSGYGYQVPGSYVPKKNYPDGYPMNRMPYPSNYQQGYPN